jgi:hypothetical protein
MLQATLHSQCLHDQTGETSTLITIINLKIKALSFIIITRNKITTCHIRGHYFVIYVTKQHRKETGTSYGEISGADSGVLEEQIFWDIRSVLT